MASDVASVLVVAMRLPPEARAAIAVELIQSLDEPAEPEDEIEAAWSDELRKRLAEADADHLTTVPWLEARGRILLAAKGRGEAR